MRVKMAYTIDLDDIPNEAKKLITEVIDWQEDLTDILANMQRVDADYFKLGEQARLKLTKIDARLEDCINLVAGELIEKPTYGACVENQVDGELYIKAKLNNFLLGYVDIREIYLAGEEV